MLYGKARNSALARLKCSRRRRGTAKTGSGASSAQPSAGQLRVPDARPGMLAARRLATFAARAAAPARTAAQTTQRRRFFLFGSGGNAPKGFGHFYPKGKTTTKGGASGKKTSGGAKASSTKKSSSGGGGDGGGGMPPDGVPRIVSALAAIGLGVVWLSSRENQGTEINWQEFATVLLESG